MIPRPTFRIVTDLFLLYVHDHSTKLHGPLSFILSCVLKSGSYLFIHLFIICIRQFDLINVLINLFILFVHGHSTKN